jgi:hypothetical protein
MVGIFRNEARSMNNDMIPIADYAAIHGVTPQTIRDRIKRGLHPEAVKMAGVWLIDKEAPYRPDGRKKRPRD